MKKTFENFKVFIGTIVLCNIIGDVLGIAWDKFVLKIIEIYCLIVYSFYEFLFTWFPFYIPPVIFDYMTISILISNSIIIASNFKGNISTFKRDTFPLMFIDARKGLQITGFIYYRNWCPEISKGDPIILKIKMYFLDFIFVSILWPLIAVKLFYFWKYKPRYKLPPVISIQLFQQIAFNIITFPALEYIANLVLSYLSKILFWFFLILILNHLVQI